MDISGHADSSEGGPVRVLVVDDAAEARLILQSVLTRQGYEVLTASDGRAGVDECRRWSPHIVLLDREMPVLDGIEVCRAIRRFSDVYIIMVTSRNGDADIVMGLSVGADDYVTKPFSTGEVLARITAVQRRPRRALQANGESEGPAPVVSVGGLVLERTGPAVSLNGQRVDLTRTEFELLERLCATPRAVTTHEHLLQQVLGAAGQDLKRVALVEMHMENLASKLENAVSRPVVESVGHAGYRLALT